MATMFSRLVIGVVAAACWVASGSGASEPEWQTWQSDVTDQMNIGESMTGYKRVGLRCAVDHMQIEVEMEEDFDGVLYTRGAFHSQEKPCFLDARGGRNFTMRLPFDKCNTKNNDNVYSNTIVLQYDDELIMPGDAAFKLECDFKNPKAYVVSADMGGEREPVESRIILENADPAAQDKPKSEQMIASSKSSTVNFSPADNAKLPNKDEL